MAQRNRGRRNNISTKARIQCFLEALPGLRATPKKVESKEERKRY